MINSKFNVGDTVWVKGKIGEAVANRYGIRYIVDVAEDSGSRSRYRPAIVSRAVPNDDDDFHGHLVTSLCVKEEDILQSPYPAEDHCQIDVQAKPARVNYREFCRVQDDDLK